MICPYPLACPCFAIPGDIASVANVSKGGIRPERYRSDSGSGLGFGDSSLGGGRLSETRVTLLLK